jgi:hypothetical protein
MFGLGCDNYKPPIDPGVVMTWDVRPAILYHYDPVLTAPDTVIAGVPFQIEVVTTIGGCNRRGPTDVRQLGLSVFEVAPKDSFYTGNLPCSHDVRPTQHYAELTFVEPGEGIILVIGRTYTRSGPDSLITIGTSVIVQ